MDPYLGGDDGGEAVRVSWIEEISDRVRLPTVHSSHALQGISGDDRDPPAAVTERSQLLSKFSNMEKRFQLEEDDRGKVTAKCRTCNARKNDPDVRKRRNIFVEMIEFDPTKWVWNETARWVRFEEDVEEGGQWSKPHLCLVPLYSLVHLREILKDSAMLLDFSGETIEEIFRAALNVHVDTGRIDTMTAGRCLNMLSLSHFHQNVSKLATKGIVHSLADFGSRAAAAITRVSHSVLPIDRSQTEVEIKNKVQDLKENTEFSDKKLNRDIGRSTQLLRVNNDSNNNQKLKINRHLQKKLPIDTESVSIMVGSNEHIEKPISAFIRLAKPTFLEDLTELSLPNRFLFILLIPYKTESIYHDVGRSMSAIICNEMSSHDIYKAKNRNDVIKGIDHFLDHALAIPPNDWDIKQNIEPLNDPLHEDHHNVPPPPEDLPTTFDYKCVPEYHPDPILERSRRCFGGLIEDIRRSAKFYVSDIKDAYNFRCLTSILFMYFACLSPIVTFGGLLSKATAHNMGTIESLMAGLLSGTVYHLCAGQPLTIIGSTGPVLIFETIVHKYCTSTGLDYMGIRVWIGIWVSLILLIVVATDACVLIKHITRFTEESFAALIGSIFIYEAIQKMYELYMFYPFDMGSLNAATLNDTKKACGKNFSIAILSPRYNPDHQKAITTCSFPLQPDVFWFSLFLFFFTFFGMVQLKGFKSSRYFPTQFRSIVSNFAAVIIFSVTVFIDHFSRIETPKLLVPTKFMTTKPDRGWFVSPFGRISVGYMFAAILPALLATILVFMDQNITSVIVNRRENKLKKGGGYHLDMLVIAICILMNSLFGLPWFVAATVLSMNHVISLKIESHCVMPGEKPTFDGIIEQRVTGFVVFLLIGLSVLLTPLLKMIPMPVLYGLFLYMGVSSLAEIQFWGRVKLLLMTSKSRPDYSFVRHVNIKKVHLFTIIQMSCTLILWLIKSNQKVSMCFPLMVAALVLVRLGLTRLFTEREMAFLDDFNPDATKKAEEDEVKRKRRKGSFIKGNGEKKFMFLNHTRLESQAKAFTIEVPEA
ncbi:hypothetical protein ACOME3_005175 [Neoechinorhynchus agilis]